MTQTLISIINILKIKTNDKKNLNGDDINFTWNWTYFLTKWYDIIIIFNKKKNNQNFSGIIKKYLYIYLIRMIFITLISTRYCHHYFYILQ